MFSHAAVFSLENVQSSMYIFYVGLPIFLRHGIPLPGQQYVNNNVTDTPKVICRYNSKYLFSSYVAEFAGAYRSQMTAADPSRKTSLLTRAWRHRSRPSWLSNMAAPICELAYFFISQWLNIQWPIQTTLKSYDLISCMYEPFYVLETLSFMVS